MILLKNISTIDLYRRLFDISYKLKDYFISWAETEQLLQEQAEIKEELYNRGYEI